MVKWFFVAILMVGGLFLVNSYLPQAWNSGFKLPIGQNGFHVSWAVVVLGSLFTLAAIKIKTK